MFVKSRVWWPENTLAILLNFDELRGGKQGRERGGGERRGGERRGGERRGGERRREQGDERDSEGGVEGGGNL